ncbi:hypothetical protein JTB14_018789 [Gonioctena quinquepunctata]|nr:hypothetical protein JTB14_018789 [Gonioctena quinquepunctata]
MVLGSPNKSSLVQFSLLKDITPPECERDSEKTISELNEDGQIKENNIKKLKNDHQSFIYKAEKNEQDMNILLERQKTIICDLQEKLMNLNKINVNTQNCFTQTTGLPLLDKSTLTEPQAVYTRGIGRKVKETVSSRCAQESTSQTEWLDQGAYEDLNVDFTKHKRKLFLVAGHNGRNMTEFLYRQSKDVFDIQGPNKPYQTQSTPAQEVTSINSSEHVYPIQTSQPPRIDTMATVTQQKNSASIPDDSPNPISLPQGTFQQRILLKTYLARRIYLTNW